MAGLPSPALTVLLLLPPLLLLLLPQDIVTRYASTTGHHVIRRFGWDCHGLPVEYEIDKKLSECAAELSMHQAA